MIRTCLYSLAFLAGLLSVAANAQIAQGVESRSIGYCNKAVDDNCPAIQVFRIDPSQQRLGVTVWPSHAINGFTYSHLIALLTRSRALAAFSGARTSPFSSDPRPYGLLRAGGVDYERTADDWPGSALLCMDTQPVTIIAVGQDYSNFPDCIQAGPILWRAGWTPQALRDTSLSKSYFTDWNSNGAHQFLVRMQDGASFIVHSDHHSLSDLADFVEQRILPGEPLIAVVTAAQNNAGYVVRTHQGADLGGDTQTAVPSALVVFPN